jgi:hypothetical protein
MAEINATFVVDAIDLTVVQEDPGITITPDPINLNIFTTTGVSRPEGNVGELQYYATGNVFGGIANSNVDAGGNLVFTNLSNLKIAGGTSAYYLQTDGTGNLTWAAGGTPTGNGVPSGANTLIQLSDGSGGFDSGAGFTFDKASNILSVPGNVVSTGIFTGDAGGLSNIVGANVTGTVANATNANIANIANSVAGANVSGAVANATYADSAGTAGTVTTNAQPNITSVGALTSLSIDGTTSLSISQEKITISNTAPTGTINFDLIDQALIYNIANATGNITLNFRGNSTTTANSYIANSKSVVASYLVTTGANSYSIDNIEIDSVPTTINWAGNAVAFSDPNTITSYSFTLIKTSTIPTYTVLGSFTRYG